MATFGLWFRVDGLVLGFFDVHEALEPAHQLNVGPDEALRPLDKHETINEIVRVEVAELQEVTEDLLVADELLHAVEEGDLLLTRGRHQRRGDGLRESGDQRGVHVGDVRGGLPVGWLMPLYVWSVCAGEEREARER